MEYDRKFAEKIAEKEGLTVKSVEKRLSEFKFKHDLESRATYFPRKGEIVGTKKWRGVCKGESSGPPGRVLPRRLKG